MNNKIFLPLAVASVLVFSTGNTDAFVLQGNQIESNIQIGNVVNIQVSQDNFLAVQTPSERTIQEIESEIDMLDQNDYTEEKFHTFITTAEQLKRLLVNESIKVVPDVVTFHGGFVGLSWETKDDKTVFLYSLPDNTLFFHMVGRNNFCEKFTTAATKQNFSSLIKKINELV